MVNERAEVRLVNFDFAVPERRLALAFFGDATTDFAEDRNDRAMRQPGQLSRLSGG
jgi:hypothetical protein